MKKYPTWYIIDFIKCNKFVIALYALIIITTIIGGSPLWWKIIGSFIFASFLVFLCLFHISFRKREELFYRDMDVLFRQLNDIDRQLRERED
jgi:hypothetical protein